MRPPVIPDTLAICATCNNAFAMQGKQECCECLLETRFAAWALADGACGGAGGPELPTVATPMEDALRWASLGTMPPRIREVPPPQLQKLPLPRSRGAERYARRIATLTGLLMLWAFAAGWCFGRLG
jgi:hypothetical protein